MIISNYYDIGNGQPCFIVAEIGINHNGSVETAKKLIDVAVLAGCQAVKFQKRTVNIVYSAEELNRFRESPFGKTNGDLKRGLEFSFEQYREIDAYCKEKNILWFASPWDEGSVNFLEQFDVPCYKVASACLTDGRLLHVIGETKKPVLVSTGMSSLEQIKDGAFHLVGGGTSPENIALLVTTSTYPAALKELRLERLFSMKTLFPGIPIGYSGHEVGLYTTLAAVAMGACIVERHITLDRASWGSDQAASVEPHGLIRLVKEIRDFEKARGDGEIGMLESERPIMEKLRRVR